MQSANFLRVMQKEGPGEQTEKVVKQFVWWAELWEQGVGDRDRKGSRLRWKTTSWPCREKPSCAAKPKALQCGLLGWIVAGPRFLELAKPELREYLSNNNPSSHSKQNCNSHKWNGLLLRCIYWQDSKHSKHASCYVLQINHNSNWTELWRSQEAHC